MDAKCLVFKLQLTADTDYFELGLVFGRKTKTKNYSISFELKAKKVKKVKKLQNMLHALGTGSIVASA